MSAIEVFLIALAIIFTVPYLIWRLGNTDYYAPLVVVQIITGILLGPGILGRRSVHAAHGDTGARAGHGRIDAGGFARRRSDRTP